MTTRRATNNFRVVEKDGQFTIEREYSMTIETGFWRWKKITHTTEWFAVEKSGYAYRFWGFEPIPGCPPPPPFKAMKAFDSLADAQAKIYALKNVPVKTNNPPVYHYE